MFVGKWNETSVMLKRVTNASAMHILEKEEEILAYFDFL